MAKSEVDIKLEEYRAFLAKYHDSEAQAQFYEFAKDHIAKLQPREVVRLVNLPVLQFANAISEHMPHEYSGNHGTDIGRRSAEEWQR